MFSDPVAAFFLSALSEDERKEKARSPEEAATQKEATQSEKIAAPEAENKELRASA